MKIHTSLYDACFRRELANAIEQDLLNKYPYLSSNWLVYSLRLRYSIAIVIDIFIHEVDRGHIFYDDLFGTTAKKYIASDIPFYCSIEIPRILCYDFCMLYFSYFYPFINEVYSIQQTTDPVTRVEFKSIIDSSIVLYDAIKKNNEMIIQKMAQSSKTSYLSITLNENKYGINESTRTSY